MFWLTIGYFVQVKFRYSILKRTQSEFDKFIFGLRLSIKYVRKIIRKTNISNPLIRKFLTPLIVYVRNGWPPF